MAERKSKDLGDHQDFNSDDDSLKSKVTVDFNVLTSLALHAPVDLVESYYRQTLRAMKRLSLSKSEVLAQVEQVGTYPNVLDMKRWLDEIERRPRKYRQDRVFLSQFHTTLESRLPPTVIKRIEKEEEA